MIREATAYHLRRTIRYFTRRPGAKITTAVLFLGVFALIAFGAYRFFVSGFTFVSQDIFLRSAFLLFMYELFLLVVAGLAFGSALIVGLFGLFRRQEDSWVMATPRYRIIPTYVAGRVFVASLWPFFAIAVPALFAIRNVFGLGEIGMALGVLAIALLLAFAVFTALGALEAVGYVLMGIRRLSGTPVVRLGWVVFLLGAGIVIVAWLAFIRLGSVDVVQLFQVQDQHATEAGTAVITKTFSAFPSHFPAVVLAAYGTGNTAEGNVALGYMGLWTLAAGAAFALLSRFYLPLWQLLQEGGFHAETHRGGPAHPVAFPRVLPGAVGALFEKEWLTLFRVPRSVLWLGFMTGLWFVQVSLNWVIRRNLIRYATDVGEAAHLLEALHIITTVYFMSAFALRFVFPAFSAERRTAWIIGSAPLDLGRVYQAKLLAYVVAFAAIGGVMTAVNIAILAAPLTETAIFIALVALSIVLVTAFALALGARFPNFETDDPEQLSTSAPGLAFTAGSLTYGAWGAFALFGFLAKDTALPLVLFFIFSIIAIVALARPPVRALRKLEFGANRD